MIPFLPKIKTTFFIATTLICSIAKSQTPTVGLVLADTGVADGYVLLIPSFTTTDNRSFLIDFCGDIVHEWPTDMAPGLSGYLLGDGTLMRTAAMTNPKINGGGRGGRIQFWDWNGTKTWDYQISDSTQTQHHDAVHLPNGNILALVWSIKDSAECRQKGRDSIHLINKSIWSEKLIEVQPIGADSGVIVWQWDNWDHIVQDRDSTKPNYGNPASHPELWDVNYLGLGNGSSDWLHANGIHYNAGLDQVAISSRHFHEIYIIDHSTTTAEAASHSGGNSGKGGDILYRWGNPEAYSRGTVSDRKLFAQHNVHWITDSLTGAGKIMIFNNGVLRPAVQYSSVDIIDPPLDTNGNYYIDTTTNVFGPDSAEWSYSAPNKTDFRSLYIGGAERLTNGNTIICDGTHGTIFEIDSTQQIRWKYICPMTNAGLLNQGSSPSSFAADGTNNWVFRGKKYSSSYAGLQGKTLTPTAPVELNPYPSVCLTTSIHPSSGVNSSVSVFPNPASDMVFMDFHSEKEGVYEVKVMDVAGKTLSAGNYTYSGEPLQLDLPLEKGMYIIVVSTPEKSKQVFKVLKQ